MAEKGEDVDDFGDFDGRSVDNMTSKDGVGDPKGEYGGDCVQSSVL